MVSQERFELPTDGLEVNIKPFSIIQNHLPANKSNGFPLYIVYKIYVFYFYL